MPQAHRPRERNTGKFIHSKWTRLCKCGHPVGVHTAERHKGSQPCIVGDMDIDCDCDVFRPTSKLISVEEYNQKYGSFFGALESENVTEALITSNQVRAAYDPHRDVIDAFSDRSFVQAFESRYDVLFDDLRNLYVDQLKRSLSEYNVDDRSVPMLVRRKDEQQFTEGDVENIRRYVITKETIDEEEGLAGVVRYVADPALLQFEAEIDPQIEEL